MCLPHIHSNLARPGEEATPYRSDCCITIRTPDGGVIVKRKYSRALTLEDRFWEKVVKRGEDECWFWLGGKNKKGYGQFHPTRTTSTSANRMSWRIHFGEISDELFVLHTCDFPECTNPKHLFLGTHQDNMDDMVAKGRSKGFEKGHIVNRVRGEQLPGSVMTELSVIEARQRHNVEKIGYKKLAKEYGVSAATMHCVLRRKTWKHIPEVASGR